MFRKHFQCAATLSSHVYLRLSLILSTMPPSGPLTIRSPLWLVCPFFPSHLNVQGIPTRSQVPLPICLVMLDLIIFDIFILLITLSIKVGKVWLILLSRIKSIAKVCFLFQIKPRERIIKAPGSIASFCSF